jgi:Ca2+-binding RTX toxin-like protein
VVVWGSLGEEDYTGIYQQRFGVDGNKVGGETLVNSTIAGEQFFASVTALEDGSWVVSWSSDGQDGDGSGIYQRHFAPDRIGGTGGDTLTGTGWAERLDGRGGADEIHGRGGDDTVIGGGGSDELFGDQGHDSLEGGSGHDTVSGGSGKDRVEGNGGNDVLYGGSARDRLYGGDGNDTVNGGHGADTLTGGTGADVFQFSDISDSAPRAFDSIRDFNRSQGDRIDLSRLDAGAYQEFIFDETAGTSPLQGHVSVSQDFLGRNTYVYVNTDKDPEADIVIHLKGLVDLTKSDFIL